VAIPRIVIFKAKINSSLLILIINYYIFTAMVFILILEDEDLHKIKQRDPQILKKIFKEYSKQIYNFLLVKTNYNKELSEDLFSETFLALIDKTGKLRHVKNIHSWLLRIANNKLIDHIRRKQIEHKYIPKLADDQQSNDDFSDQFARKQKILMVKIALDKVKSEYREVLTLKYLEDRKREEIASLLKKSDSAIDGLLFRAKAALKKEIKKIMKDF
jgi:RNA polymerase sigma-70 factor (ECF subfamily)